LRLRMNNFLKVAVIQTSLNAEAAWVDDALDWKNSIKMSLSEEGQAKRDIRHFIGSIRSSSKNVDIILLPELSVPLSYVRVLKKAAENLEAVVIAGLDYTITGDDKKPAVSNEAIIIVPSRLNGKRISSRTSSRRIGKTYAAPGEERKLHKITSGPVIFDANPVIWLFKSSDLGDFAVAICYDFMDLDRIAMYRGKIQTLFILAYNQDTTSFDHLAEAISRTVFCNVVISNCGYFGGSLAISPFREAYKRTVYKHSGTGLSNAQIIKLPLASIKSHQANPVSKDFKSLPPGFDKIHTHPLWVSKV